MSRLPFLVAIALVGLGIAVVSLAITCIPRPEKQIDYLELPEAILVQAKTDHGPTLHLEVEKACLVPDFTLYGDGTAVFVRDATVRRGELSKGEVLDLIKPLVDNGYMDYNYDQGLRDPEAFGTQTFLYVHTQDAANAVQLVQISIGTPSGEEGKQYRNITSFLDKLDAYAATAQSEEFTSDQTLLVALAWDGPTPGGVVPWDSATDLGLLAPAGSNEVKTLRIDFVANPELTPHFVTRDERTFLVCTRPVLPYEDNFPEFDDSTS